MEVLYELIFHDGRQLQNLSGKGKIEKEVAEKEIRIFEFLATCDTDDLCRMVDSTAFNEIILFAVKENSGKKDLFGNEFAKELVEDALYRLHFEPVKYDEEGNRIKGERDVK